MGSALIAKRLLTTTWVTAAALLPTTVSILGEL
jgi:hypothetical protein